MYLITRLPNQLQKMAVVVNGEVLRTRTPQYVNLTNSPDPQDQIYEGREEAAAFIIVEKFRDEAQVLAFVSSLAAKNPGVTYYLSSLLNAVTCPAAPPAITKFTEKGVLPA
jgi:hypothetical protein